MEICLLVRHDDHEFSDWMYHMIRAVAQRMRCQPDTHFRHETWGSDI
jgi:hypothetical protein